jgi:hypothetical protein
MLVQVQQVLQEIYNHFYPSLIALTAIGAVTMAVLQTLKDMFPLRRIFQKIWLKGWLQKRALDAPDVPVGKKPDPEVAENDLIRLATSKDVKAFYDLPIEQLCGQANAALQVALDYPGDHTDLIWCFGSLAEDKDLNALLHPPTTLRKNRSQMTEGETQAVDAYAAARNRVAHYVQRSIDSVQIAAGFRWKFYLQLCSIILCFVFSLVGLFESAATKDMPLKFPAAIAIGILAGFLAPVARDLVAALQQFRK